MQKNEEYLEKEKKYLPSYSNLKAVILAAGGPGSLDFDRPKALLKMNGKSILEHQLEAVRSVGVSDISIVRGYKKEEICVPGVTMIDNDKWAGTDVAHSLSLAAAVMDQPYLALYSDVFFKRYLLRAMLDYSKEVHLLM